MRTPFRRTLGTLSTIPVCPTISHLFWTHLSAGRHQTEATARPWSRSRSRSQRARRRTPFQTVSRTPFLRALWGDLAQGLCSWSQTRRARSRASFKPPPPRTLSPLSEENLHALYKEVMDSTANNARPGSIKRSSSRRSTTAGSDVFQETTRTKGSSSTNAHYRFEVLSADQINIHADPPPRNIQDAIDAIAYAKPSEGRREQLELIIREFQAPCIERARASVGENDFVKILHDALDAMRFDILCLRTNADWNDQLNPNIQHSLQCEIPALQGRSPATTGWQRPTPPPAKRQQQAVGQPYNSPQPSIANGSDPAPTNGLQESVTVLPLAPPHVP